MSSMEDKDYYEILGVSKDASSDEIRKAFQQKARKLHPDVNKEPDAEEKFKEVSEAYAVLSDDEKRQRYDAMRSGAPYGYGGGSSAGAGGYGYGGGSPYSWGPFPTGGRSYRRSGSSRAYNPREGADVVYDLEIDAATAAKGTRRGVTYQRYVACDVCNGTGSVAHEHSETCPTCGGRGRISVDLGSIFSMGVMEMECPECEGTGRVVSDPCSSCGGTGRTLTASEVVVNIPEGSHDGDEVRVTGMGNAGTNGSSSGDFVCRVSVLEERLTQSQGNGFYLIGFTLPFIVLGLLLGMTYTFAAIIIVLLVVGVILVVKDGVKFSKRWWKNALGAMGNGASNSVGWAIVIALFMSCSMLSYAPRYY